MEKDTLLSLEKVNQLALSDEERGVVLDFFAAAEADAKALDKIDTADVACMVHVLPVKNALREDVAKKPFTREELQKGAPETMDGYWQVPRVVE